MLEPTRDLSDQVKRQMNRAQIHDAWEHHYRSPANERFFEQAYDDLVRRIGKLPGGRALDIGCGICANSMRLARRGYIVSAADYSEPILAQARDNVSRNQLLERVTISREDILNLSFPDDHFDLVLCWGVLMHIPEAERAISQLTRVAKPGGFIVMEEVNQNAPEARVMRLVWSALKKGITVTKTPRGYEQISRFNGETLFWRQVNTAWLVAQFARHSCILVRRDSSMPSEMYIYAPGKLIKDSIHGWNRLWARHLNVPQLALHNVFLFRKN
jgi:2-polyprenyl-3-methyl-5-hydroxy-6-metoxy-1,4-benzoquinol methylase